MVGSFSSPVSVAGGGVSAGTRDVRRLRYNGAERVEVGHDQGGHLGRAADGVRAASAGRIAVAGKEVFRCYQLRAVLASHDPRRHEILEVGVGQQRSRSVGDGLNQAGFGGEHVGQESRMSGGQAESRVPFLAQPQRILVVDGEFGLDDLERRLPGHQRLTVQRGDDVVSGIGPAAGTGERGYDRERGRIGRRADPERSPGRCGTAGTQPDLVRA